jgi:hypothetical protein
MYYSPFAWRYWGKPVSLTVCEDEAIYCPNNFSSCSNFIYLAIWCYHTKRHGYSERRGKFPCIFNLFTRWMWAYTKQRSLTCGIIRTIIIVIRSRGSSVSLVFDYGLDDRGSIPGRGKGFFFQPLRLDRFWGPPGTGGTARPGREADHSPHLVLRSRMSRSHTSSPPKRRHGAQRDSFIYYYYCCYAVIVGKSMLVSCQTGISFANSKTLKIPRF